MKHAIKKVKGSKITLVLRFDRDHSIILMRLIQQLIVLPDWIEYISRVLSSSNFSPKYNSSKLSIGKSVLSCNFALQFIMESLESTSNCSF